jgi:hypothetical protein
MVPRETSAVFSVVVVIARYSTDEFADNKSVSLPHCFWLATFVELEMSKNCASKSEVRKLKHRYGHREWSHRDFLLLRSTLP